MTRESGTPDPRISPNGYQKSECTSKASGAKCLQARTNTERYPTAQPGDAHSDA